ncbi:MAG: PspC domain-containing protein [Candidatus Parcubacteria bacterium]|nr:PspC domain-containing protein [Candidatus Parcubacteria bacterium]
MSIFLTICCFVLIVAGCIALAMLTKKIGLQRDPHNEVIAGVCAGLAKKLNIQPLAIRAAFVLSVLILGIGILPYIVLWVTMEEERG